MQMRDRNKSRQPFINVSAYSKKKRNNESLASLRFDSKAVEKVH